MNNTYFISYVVNPGRGGGTTPLFSNRVMNIPEGIRTEEDIHRIERDIESRYKRNNRGIELTVSIINYRAM